MLVAEQSLPTKTVRNLVRILCAAGQFKALYDENEVVGIKTGLGLHLIRDLAKAINCKILVENNNTTGTRFTLELT